MIRQLFYEVDIEAIKQETCLNTLIADLETWKHDRSACFVIIQEAYLHGDISWDEKQNLMFNYSYKIFCK